MFVLYCFEVKNMKVNIPPIELDEDTYQYLTRMAKVLKIDSIGQLLAEELREKLNELELWLERVWLVEDQA